MFRVNRVTVPPHLLFACVVVWLTGCQDTPYSPFRLAPATGQADASDPDTGQGGEPDTSQPQDTSTPLPDTTNPGERDTSVSLEDTPVDRPSDGIAWQDCRLYTGSDMFGPSASCAIVPMPLSHEQPDDGPTLPIFIKRLSPSLVGRTDPEPRGQLWLLSGGPGGASDGLESLADDYHSIRGWDLDIYLIDHRGVGRSERLGCIEEPIPNRSSSAWEDCIDELQQQYGDGFNRFTTTEAAHDVGTLIATTRLPGQDVYVLGISYGTYWAHRYLQLYPTQADGVVLDSICLPGLCLFDNFDVGFNDTGRDYMELCGADPLCRTKLGSDPWSTTRRVLDRLEDGHCAEVMEQLPDGRAFLRAMLGFLLTDRELRHLIPALVYRLDRCDPADVVALEQAVELLVEVFNTPQDPLYSAVINRHVGFTELWSDPAPSIETMRARLDQLTISNSITVSYAELRLQWPLYPRDRFVGQLANTSTPLLMLNGTLDPQTPIAIAAPAADIFEGPFQHFVAIPEAAHATLTLQAPTRDGQSCGFAISLGFLADPTQPLDLSCLDQLAPVTFDDPRGYSTAFFGTDNLWENAAGKSTSSSVTQAQRQQLTRQLKERLRKARQRLRIPAMPPTQP
ncbi:MAG: alpha/beta fold hydrolase [Myxococcota bacterium]